MERDTENQPSRSVHVLRSSPPQCVLTAATCRLWRRGVYSQQGIRHAPLDRAPTPSREETIMNPLKRLWHWYKDRRLERQGLKGQWSGEPNRAQGTTPIVGIAEDARLRWLIKSGRR